MTTANEEFLSPEEVGDQLGVSVYTVRRWVKAGQLRAFKPGKEYRIRQADLEEFIRAREVRPKAPRRSPFEPSLLNGLEDERRDYESRVWERINLLERAAEQWQRFIDEGLYDLEKLDLETLKAIDAVSLNIGIVHTPDAATMKRVATHDQREQLEQAEQRLINTNLEFWARVEAELSRRKVADLEAFKAWRTERERASRSRTA